MSLYLIDSDVLSDIAKSIREQKGSEEGLAPETFASQIRTLNGQGVADLLTREITNITIPTDITKLGDYALAGCKSIQHLDIPSNIVTIGNNSFQDCLGCLVYDFSTHTVVPSLGVDAFLHINSDTDIVVPYERLYEWQTSWAHLVQHLRAKIHTTVGISCQYEMPWISDSLLDNPDAAATPYYIRNNVEIKNDGTYFTGLSFNLDNSFIDYQFYAPDGITFKTAGEYEFGIKDENGKIVYKVFMTVINSLKNKLVYGFGDSLVAGHYSGNGMVDGLAADYELEYNKLAVNGHTITIDNKTTNVYTQVQAAPTIAPDFVVFDGLTNDVNQNDFVYPLGTISDGFDASLDTSTFTGSFEATIKLLKSKYPTTKIIFVTPHKMPTRQLDYFKQLVDRAVLICNKWGISVADVYYQGGIDTTIDEQRVKYSYNDIESEGNGNGTHLTKEGYDLFYAPLIVEQMLSDNQPLD